MQAVSMGRQCSAARQGAGKSAALVFRSNATRSAIRVQPNDAAAQAWIVRDQTHIGRNANISQGRSATVAQSSWRESKADTITVIPVTFKIHYKCTFGQNLYLLGSTPEMGNWDVENALLMTWEAGDMWSAKLPIEAGSHVEYKYLVKGEDGTVVRWQDEGNIDLDLELPELTLFDTWARESRHFDWRQPGGLDSEEQVLVGDVPAGTQESRPAFSEVFSEQVQPPMDGSIIELAKAWLERNQLEPVEAGFVEEQPMQQMSFQPQQQQQQEQQEQQEPAAPRRRWGRFEKVMAGM